MAALIIQSLTNMNDSLAKKVAGFIPKWEKQKTSKHEALVSLVKDKSLRRKVEKDMKVQEREYKAAGGKFHYRTAAMRAKAHRASEAMKDPNFGKNKPF